jgi:hypothetical protein
MIRICVSGVHMRYVYYDELSGTHQPADYTACDALLTG